MFFFFFLNRKKNFLIWAMIILRAICLNNFLLLFQFFYFHFLFLFIYLFIYFDWLRWTTIDQYFQNSCRLQEIFLAKVFLHFNKIPRKVCYKKSPPEAFSEGWSQSAREILWWNWWRFDEIRIIINLSQKYEGNLGY